MLLVAADPFFVGRRDKLVALAAKHSLPSMWKWPEFVEGGLISYGKSIIDTFRQVGVYPGRVLKGENPADLPVIRPVKFELVINLKRQDARHRSTCDAACPRRPGGRKELGIVAVQEFLLGTKRCLAAQNARHNLSRGAWKSPRLSCDHWSPGWTEVIWSCQAKPEIG
jgi:hypothetical protein